MRTIYILLGVLVVIHNGSAQMANFTTSPSNLTLPRNNDASFECAANRNGQSLQVFWHVRRGDTILAIIGINGTLNGTEGVTVGTNGSSLTLSSVSRSLDGVTVSCVARIDIGTFVEQPEPWANLRVTIPPEVSVAVKSINVTVGESTAFSYTVTDGDPPGFRLSLLKGNETSSKPFNATHVIFSSVTESDDGTYTLRAEGISGIGSDTFTLVVGTVAQEPTFKAGLGPGEIAGIAVGSFVGVSIIVGTPTIIIGIYYYKKRKP